MRVSQIFVQGGGYGYGGGDGYGNDCHYGCYDYCGDHYPHFFYRGYGCDRDYCGYEDYHR